MAMHSSTAAVEVRDPELDASGRASGAAVRSWIRRGSLCVAVASLLIGGTVHRHVPSWGANDDVTMVAFANGDYSGGVASRLVHINVVAGQALAFLFSWFPRVPWYSLMLWAAWGAAWSTALFLALSGAAHGRAGRLALAVAAIAVGFPGAALVLTFTAGGFALGVTGLLFLAAAAERTRLAAWFAAGIGGTALVLASLIRWDSFFGILLAFLPVWAAIASRAGLRRSLLAAATVAIAAFGLHMIDQAVTVGNDEWRAYEEFSGAHRDLMRGNRLAPSEDLRAAVQALGWDPGDVGLLKAFVFADPDVYTTDALRTLRDSLPAQRVAEASEVFEIAVKPYRHFAWALLGICLVQLVRSRRFLTRVWIVGSVVWLLAVVGYLTMYVRFPSRMANPFWASALIVAAIVPDLLLTREFRSRPIMQMAPVARVVVIGATFVGLFMVTSNAADRLDGLARYGRGSHFLYESDAATLHDIDPDGIFVGSGGTVTTTGTDPRDALTAFGELDYIELGWPTFSPHYQRRLANMGITNLYEDLVFREGFYLVARGTIASALQQSLLRNHGWDVKFTEVATLHRDVSVWVATGAKRDADRGTDENP